MKLPNRYDVKNMFMAAVGAIVMLLVRALPRRRDLAVFVNLAGKVRSNNVAHLFVYRSRNENKTEAVWIASSPERAESVRAYGLRG